MMGYEALEERVQQLESFMVQLAGFLDNHSELLEGLAKSNLILYYYKFCSNCKMVNRQKYRLFFKLG
jgi:hypothetical protein